MRGAQGANFADEKRSVLTIQHPARALCHGFAVTARAPMADSPITVKEIEVLRSRVHSPVSISDIAHV
jgi:hypothetical protein